ncbi:lysylphosphatidylglycerol synthase transmembrane domain-containing protein [Pseudomonadota bacterium]
MTHRLRSGRRWLGLSLKLAISMSLVWLLLDAVGAGEAWARMRTADPAWLSFALAMSFLQGLICALRWQAVLRAIDATLGLWRALKFWYIGAFFNQTLPSSVGGDVVRGYFAYKDGLSLPQVLNSLFLDRAATVLALVVLVTVMTPFVAGDLEGGAWFQRAVWLALVVALAGLVIVMVMDRLPQGLAKYRVVKALHLLAVDSRRVLLHPFSGTQLMAWSLIGHVNLALVMWSLFRALGVEVSVLDCTVLFLPVLLAQILPISVAGWGVREGAMVAMFTLAGVPGDASVAASILFGIVFIVSSMPGAALWLATGKRSRAEAEAFAENSGRAR